MPCDPCLQVNGGEVMRSDIISAAASHSSVCMHACMRREGCTHGGAATTSPNFCTPEWYAMAGGQAGLPDATSCTLWPLPARVETWSAMEPAPESTIELEPHTDLIHGRQPTSLYLCSPSSFGCRPWPSPRPLPPVDVAWLESTNWMIMTETKRFIGVPAIRWPSRQQRDRAEQPPSEMRTA